MTFVNDLENSVVLANGANSLAPATRTSSANGAGVDLGEAEGNCFAIQHIGTVSGTSPTLDGKLQESNDDSTFTDITGATFTQVTASNKCQMITFKRTKRYVRGVQTIAGTSPSFAGSLLIAGLKKAI